MEQFEFIAEGADGKQIQGYMEAHNAQEVVERLSQKSLSVVSCKKIGTTFEDPQIQAPPIMDDDTRPAFIRWNSSTEGFLGWMVVASKRVIQNKLQALFICFVVLLFCLLTVINLIVSFRPKGDTTSAPVIPANARLM